MTLKDFFLASDAGFQKREKEKARKIRKSSWWKKVVNQGNCYYCNGRFLVHEMTMDHKVPIIRGGRSVKNNLVPCCKACNSKKGSMTSVEWFERKTSRLE